MGNYSNHSRLVYPDEILNLDSADRALLEILAALDASSIMLARHIDTVFVLVAAYHTGIGVTLLTDQRHLDLAGIGLVGPDFEDSLVLDLEEVTLLALY